MAPRPLFDPKAAAAMPRRAARHGFAMADEAKPHRYGGKGNRNPDGSKYRPKRFHIAAKPPPKDFVETFIEMGYDAERYYQCRWPVFRRWIDESGGEELLEKRRAYVRENRCPHRVVRHVGGWTAEKLDAMRRERNS